MKRNAESILQRVSQKLIRESETRGYGATPVNTSGKENNWDIEKICVTHNGNALCDINCVTDTISYKNAPADRNEVEAILKLIDYFQEQREIYLDAPHLKVSGLEKYKLLAEYNNVVFVRGIQLYLD